MFHSNTQVPQVRAWTRNKDETRANSLARIETSSHTPAPWFWQGQDIPGSLLHPEVEQVQPDFYAEWESLLDITKESDKVYLILTLKGLCCWKHKEFPVNSTRFLRRRDLIMKPQKKDLGQVLPVFYSEDFFLAHFQSTEGGTKLYKKKINQGTSRDSTLMKYVYLQEQHYISTVIVIFKR